MRPVGLSVSRGGARVDTVGWLVVKRSFINALVDIAQEKEEAAQGAGEAHLMDLRDRAMEKVEAGQGDLGFLTSGSSNGKAATQERAMTADEMLSAASEALRIFRGQSVVMTNPDFSQLLR